MKKNNAKKRQPKPKARKPKAAVLNQLPPELFGREVLRGELHMMIQSHTHRAHANGTPLSMQDVVFALGINAGDLIAVADDKNSRDVHRKYLKELVKERIKHNVTQREQAKVAMPAISQTAPPLRKGKRK